MIIMLDAPGGVRPVMSSKALKRSGGTTGRSGSEC